MLVRRCPICSRDVPPRAVNRAFPFCSDRCRLIDLGTWLGEEYRVPSRPEEIEDEDPAGGRGGEGPQGLS
jgi:endogenous inhibitor of DNA gyrase (YacG/DUF329 family)